MNWTHCTTRIVFFTIPSLINQIMYLFLQTAVCYSDGLQVMLVITLLQWKFKVCVRWREWKKVIPSFYQHLNMISKNLQCISAHHVHAVLVNSHFHFLNGIPVCCQVLTAYPTSSYCAHFSTCQKNKAFKHPTAQRFRELR